MHLTVGRSSRHGVGIRSKHLASCCRFACFDTPSGPASQLAAAILPLFLLNLAPLEHTSHRSFRITEVHAPQAAGPGFRPSRYRSPAPRPRGRSPAAPQLAARHAPPAAAVPPETGGPRQPRRRQRHCPAAAARRSTAPPRGLCWKALPHGRRSTAPLRGRWWSGQRDNH